MKKKMSIVVATLTCILTAMPVMAQDIEVTDLNEVNPYYAFTLDGAQYQLPCRIADLKQNGWEFNYHADTDTMSGMTYMATDMVKGDASISIEPWNPNGGVITMGDAMVASISVDTNSQVDFTTFDGLCIGSIKDDIVKLRGDVSESEASNGIYSYSYKVPQEKLTFHAIGAYEGDNETEFRLVNGGDQVEQISLEYFVFPEDADLTVSAERPAYLDSYQAPTSLGSKIEDLNMEVNGKLLTFPIPTNVFMNEFNMTCKDEISVPGQSYRSVILYDENEKSAGFCLYNNADYMVSLDNSFIGGFDFEWADGIDLKAAQDSLTFSGGVKFGMSEEELFSICPELKDVTPEAPMESGDFIYKKIAGNDIDTYYVSNKNTDSGVHFELSKDRGIYSITVDPYRNWGR